jgi:hypothetical protein
MGNIGTETESMEQQPESGFVVPVEHERFPGRSNSYAQYERSNVRY